MLQSVTKCVGREPDERVLEMTKVKEEKIKKTFEITNTELRTTENCNHKKAIVNLVIERVALLSTQL
jgi:hypothetical protein